jgi:DCN1-like protein 1/2
MASAGPNAASVNKALCQTLYKKYLPANAQNWDEDEIGKFFEDLGIDCGEDILFYLISMHMGCEHMGMVTEQEFCKGCEAVGADSIDKWKAQIPNMRKQLQSPDIYKKMYRFVFIFAQPWREGIKKNVRIEDAV